MDGGGAERNMEIAVGGVAVVAVFGRRANRTSTVNFNVGLSLCSSLLSLSSARSWPINGG